MKTFITAVPLFDKNMTVYAYFLCNHNGERPLGTSFGFQMLGDQLKTKTLDFVEDIGVDALTGGLPLLIEVNEYQLRMNTTANISVPHDKLVFVLPKDLRFDEPVEEVCKTLIDLGYKFAISNNPVNGAYGKSVSVADYLFLDYSHPSFTKHLDEVKPLMKGKTVVITGIPDRAAFKSLASIEGAVFTGDFYDRPVSAGAKEISPIKINALKLLRQVNEEDSDLVLIADTIERDPSISVSLLRFINSVGVGLSHRVESIRAAVAILGQSEMKRWVTVAVSVALAEDRPGEITKLSLIRAKFAENLARNSDKSFLASSLFTTGLFSMLDIILGIPMKDAVAEVAISTQIQKALVDREGELFEFMELIYAYEHADWDTVSLNMLRNNFDAEKITRSFIDAMIWYKNLLIDIEDAL